MAIINYFANPASYNSTYSDSVYEAALAVAAPFLVQQKNQVIAGATVNEGTVEYNGNSFTVYTDYINPGNGYYTPTPSAFNAVWPKSQFPNAIYDPGASAFNATIDCVGFASRVLISVGDTPDDPQNNAFSLLHDQIDTNAVHFAAPGIVPTAFEFAVALPALLPGRWSYVSGNVNASAIKNQSDQSSKNYTGVPKGGFAGAQAGDIVCFGYERGASNGHFMVLTTAPQPVDMNQFDNLPEFVQNAYIISVYDSTDSGFSLHFNDSRLNDGDGGSGVGYGQLYLFTNAADEPVGFIFGPAGDGMEMAHFIYELVPPEPKQLIVAAISIGRFE